MFDKIEKTRSAAAEEGWTFCTPLTNVGGHLHVFSTTQLCPNVWETSSAAAKYLIQVLIDQNLERENIILLCAPIIL